MAISFSELWEKCEQNHKSYSNENVLEIVDLLIMKINLYKMLDGNLNIDKDELKKAKSRTLGEILLSITNLSLIDDINVYEALSVAQQHLESINSVQPNFKLP